MEYGKLWCYNLNYFDFLNQYGMDADMGKKLIYEFIKKIHENKIGLEPYPTSLRIINWIKFLTAKKIKDEFIDGFLYGQTKFLRNNLEYHLLGNHLLENGFALLFGAYYFKDQHLYRKAKEILITELHEQILSDGAHFELSPMYHQIILHRILDCINLIKNNAYFNNELLHFLIETAGKMMGWINTMTFTNGDIPLLNDSIFDVAPTTKQLLSYADRLNVWKVAPTVLCNESGYRKIDKSNYEIVVDIGNIGPDYIPGHGHSDTFNFILYIDGKPFIIDTGVSAYEISTERQYQRSTSAHNTVQIGSYEQSEIWASFRVGRRARIIDKEENENFICATHDGYKRIGALHTRKFDFLDRLIRITDNIKYKSKHTCYAYIHFHPDVSVMIEDNTVFFDSKKIIISDYDAIRKGKYDFAAGFNKLVKAAVIVIIFRNNLHMEIAT
ncbi:MAG: alginate lyase family protein [Nitrospirota bacterium]